MPMGGLIKRVCDIDDRDGSRDAGTVYVDAAVALVIS